MRLRLSMKMQMRITPQLVLAGELLRMSNLDLEQRISQELKENPALEQIHQDATKGDAQVKFVDRPTQISLMSKFDRVNYPHELSNSVDSLEKMARREPVMSQLIAQASLFVTDKDLEAVTALFYALDANGYLRSSSEQLAAQLRLERADIERLIPVLHELEPPGIGARDLRECLSIQYRYLETQGIHCTPVKEILELAWEDFAAQRWGRVAKKLGITKSELDSARRFIAQNLYPHPLGLMNDEGNSEALHHPDLIILRHKQDEEITFALEVPAEAFELRLSQSFTRAIAECSAGEEELSTQERDWLALHLERARLFITSLQKRWETLRRIGEFIIEFQKGFLEAGTSHLKPLTQAMVANALGCHESTVSRAVNNKVVQLPNGHLVPMEIFFDASLPVKAALRQILADSQHAISDREMTERLAQAGYSVARRTVTKYRAQINQVGGF